MSAGPQAGHAQSMDGACAVASGCRYLRTLAIIEQLAGFETTAGGLSGIAAECRDRGCSVMRSQMLGMASAAARGPIPFPTTAARPLRPCGERERTGTGEALVFSRVEKFDTVSDGAGNRVERRTLKLDDLKRAAPLDELYQYWRWLRSVTRCEFANIDTVTLMRMGIIGRLHVVDVSSADPNDFRFELTAYAVPLGHYPRPRAFPIAIYADCTLRDYNTVRMTAVPRLQLVRARLGGIGAHYMRLILPFWDKRDRVARLAVAIHREPGDGIRYDA